MIEVWRVRLLLDNYLCVFRDHRREFWRGQSPSRTQGLRIGVSHSLYRRSRFSGVFLNAIRALLSPFDLLIRFTAETLSHLDSAALYRKTAHLRDTRGRIVMDRKST